MSEENKAVVRRFLDALWNRADFEVIDSLIARDYESHSSTVIHGPDGARQLVIELRAAFPDFEFRVADQIAEGDHVATCWTIYGTHRGRFQGIPASGRPIRMNGITMFRLAEGKLVEEWIAEDQLGVLQQLGVLPPPGLTLRTSIAEVSHECS